MDHLELNVEVISMRYSADAWVMLFLVIVIVVWIGYGISKWLKRPPSSMNFLLQSAPPGSGPNKRLLEQHHYEVLSGKVRIPIKVRYNQQTLNTRIYLDYVVMQDDDVYVVKIAKDRDNIKWSGSSIRDHFLALALLHDQVAGVIYLDPKQQAIHKIQFDFER